LLAVLVRYDSEADATYVELEPEATAARTIELLDAHLLVDVDESGHPIGIELLCGPGEVDPTTFTAIAERFPDLDIDALQTALAGTRSATA
jgi:uncharacterized protein YuzE